MNKAFTIAQRAEEARNKVIQDNLYDIDLYDRIIISQALSLLAVALKDGVGLREGATLSNVFKEMRGLSLRYDL